MRYQLCESKGARICEGCARNVEHASEADASRAGPLMRPDGEGERCRLWAAKRYPARRTDDKRSQAGAVSPVELAILAALGVVLSLVLWSLDRSALVAQRDAARSEIDALESAREAQELAWTQRQEQDRYDLQVCQQQWSDQSARAADALKQARRETQNARERLARFLAGAEKAGGPATACGAAALELARACTGLEEY